MLETEEINEMILEGTNRRVIHRGELPMKQPNLIKQNPGGGVSVMNRLIKLALKKTLWVKLHVYVIIWYG